MNSRKARGAQVLRQALVFTVRLWGQRPWLAGGIALAMCLATVTEIFIPLFAGRLVDAIAQSPAGGARGVTEPVLIAFGAMAALGLAMIVLRHFDWWGIVPLTLGIMSRVANESFHRVQRFSTDRHANSFAGSTVRKITRGMWALDSLNDVLLLALLPSLVVLVGSVLVLALRWPVMGLVMGAGAVAYVLLTATLAIRLIAPASRLSNAQDTRIGGTLADALGSNAVVKAFGAEHREEHRLERVLE